MREATDEGCHYYRMSKNERRFLREKVEILSRDSNYIYIEQM